MQEGCEVPAWGTTLRQNRRVFALETLTNPEPRIRKTCFPRPGKSRILCRSAPSDKSGPSGPTENPLHFSRDKAQAGCTGNSPQAESPPLSQPEAPPRLR